MIPKKLESTRHATPEHSPQYGIYDPDGTGTDIAIVKGDEKLASLFRASAEMFSTCKNALADLEGIMPEVDPSGDRTHPAWKTIEELRAVISSVE